MKSEREILRKTKKDYNLISSHFSSTRKRPWRDFEFLFEDLQQGAEVLDLGCGNGRFFEVFKKKGVNYKGVDKAEKLIEKAKNKLPKVDFLVGDGLDLPFSANSFDYVFSVAVFHHLPSMESRIKFLKEIKRVLKSGGEARVSVWNLLETDKKVYFSDLGKKIIGKIGFRDLFLPWKNDKGEVVTERYYHAFKKKELKELAEKAGFVTKKVFIAGEGVKSNIFLFLEND